ncbi:bifunctional riboflavin kinase/FAD synthetase [Alkalibacillus sp. S2W]|uniref:bifunctional riboflavin kinase/FAD synthetase n=1 Tax=Alkalibacillus sp. S2W TaxID=3386553 RepID=UPI00398D0176
MEVIELSLKQTEPMPVLDDVSLAVGYFDGVHTGHQRVIQKAIDEAERQGIKSGVMTFSPHPLTVIKNRPLLDYLITTHNEKIKEFRKFNLDYVVVITFNHDLAQLSPQAFVDQFFIALNVKHVVGGFDFSFGHKGAGKIQQMDEYAKNTLTYSVVDEVSSDGEKISSSRIRDLIKEGDMAESKRLLGRSFSIEANVEYGYQRGREIGYPTANLDVNQEHIIPRVGVYAIQVYVNNTCYDGMASVGFNPTFGQEHDQPIIEAHLFDFDDDLYAVNIEVLFLHYIRDEKAFSEVTELIKRIEQDEIEAKNFIRSYSS